MLSLRDLRYSKSEGSMDIYLLRIERIALYLKKVHKLLATILFLGSWKIKFFPPWKDGKSLQKQLFERNFVLIHDFCVLLHNFYIVVILRKACYINYPA